MFGKGYPPAIDGLITDSSQPQILNFTLIFSAISLSPFFSLISLQNITFIRNDLSGWSDTMDQDKSELEEDKKYRDRSRGGGSPLLEKISSQASTKKTTTLYNGEHSKTDV